MWWMLRRNGYASLAGALLLALAVSCSSSGNDDPFEEVAEDPTRAPDAAATPQRIGGWDTDVSKRIIELEELTQGQVKDGIPSINDPKFEAVADVEFLTDKAPVVAFREGDDARAYPLEILTWHEIVNDVVGGRPVIVTFCPLCNTAIAFDRVVDGRELSFGVSGFLRNSDLVMFDRETETWWQQVTGEALVGELVGTQLDLLPSAIVSWADFRAEFPGGKVLSRDTGFVRSYGTNPYSGYDDAASTPFLYDGEFDERLQAMDRVVAVELGGDVAAYPFSRLEANPVANDEVGGMPIVVLFKLGTVSALDRSAIADSRDIGSATAYSAVVDGERLTFSSQSDLFQDEETGSTWNVFGRAIDGPLKGSQLEPVVSGNHFWFAWVAFKPETRVWDGTQ
jgi:hypothetical protein